MGPSPMNSTSTLYDVLGLPSTASEGDIHAAHMRLVRHYQYGINGLSAAEANQQLQAVKGAWWTLSDPGRRAAYDAGLAAAFAHAAAAAPTAAASPAASGPATVAPAAAGILPPVIEVELKSPKRSPLRIMLGVIGSLMIVGLALQIYFSMFAFRQLSGNDAALEAQQRLVDAERRQTYGDLTDKEIAELESQSVLQREENRQQEEERRKAFAQKQEEYERERALRERKNYADQVSNELRRQEEVDKLKANWERQQREYQARREQAEEDARVQQRLAREREQWRRELQR